MATVSYIQTDLIYNDNFPFLFQYSIEYVRGYDIDGNEILWIVTSGNVNSLALVDFNNDGKNEVNKLKI